MYWCYEDLQMYYETVGEGVPVLMLHGYYVDHHIMTGCLEPVLEQAECAGYKRIYLDLPGMGKTKSVFLDQKCRYSVRSSVAFYSRSNW